MDTLTRSRELEALRQLENAVQDAHDRNVETGSSYRVRTLAAELVNIINSGLENS